MQLTRILQSFRALVSLIGEEGALSRVLWSHNASTCNRLAEHSGFGGASLSMRSRGICCPQFVYNGGGTGSRPELKEPLELLITQATDKTERKQFMHPSKKKVPVVGRM